MTLLDAHAFVWLASDQNALSPAALGAIKKDRESLFISVVTCWEIALLHKKGRLLLPLPPNEFVEKAALHHGVQDLPLTREIAMAAVALPEIHNDPFDRILVAEALHHGCRLVTKDETIPLYPGVKAVW
ncbi:MAG: type II toxin-antitoxin system VapC family toxin [Verrucomicrobia bacterium]|nr:type II toxin-antitoxin system VapC family toxin [Verrucomicrobiota bacterium]